MRIKFVDNFISKIYKVVILNLTSSEKEFSISTYHIRKYYFNRKWTILKSYLGDTKKEYCLYFLLF